MVSIRCVLAALSAVGATAAQRRLGPWGVRHLEYVPQSPSIRVQQPEKILPNDGRYHDAYDEVGESDLREPLECFQVSAPVVAPSGHDGSWTTMLMEHNFGNSYGQPFVGHYKPPSHFGFNRAIINFTVVSEGRQFDRLATMWLDDIETFRTSTAEPKQSPGIRWSYIKDMTSYMALWSEPQTIIFDLGNLLTEKYTGWFNTTLSVTLFKVDEDDTPPADVILPISAKRGNEGRPSSFIYPSQKAESSIQVPHRNIKSAILAVAATGQAEEEFWWSNVPESVTNYFNQTSRVDLPGKGSFREVVIRIDEQVMALAWPFPVVFTGGISPPLHRPVVGIQAFDMLEQEIDITPWVGILADGEEHVISLEVIATDDTGTPSIVSPDSNWVLSAKLLMWLDEDTTSVSIGAAPEVRYSNFGYQAAVHSSGDTAFAYEQGVTRSFTLSADIWTQQGHRHVTLEQNMTMRNQGSVKELGFWQQVNGDYQGYEVSCDNGVNQQANRWSYPISTTYEYKIPDGNYSLSLQAELYQGHRVHTTGQAPWSVGQESSVGTIFETYRNGSAFFYQIDGGKKSGGWGDVSQRLSICSDEAASGEAFGECPGEIYSREVHVVNETVVKDEENDLNFLPPEIAAQWRNAEVELVQDTGSFAPLDEAHPGGTNIFFNGR